MKTFLIVSLGCPKNTVDSEVMAGTLMRDGYTPVAEIGDFVDVAIINTCGFIEEAKQESIEKIFELVEAKEAGRIGKLTVAGCMAQRYPDALKKEIPEIDVLFGIDGVEHITGFLTKERIPEITPSPQYIYSHESPRAVSTGRSYAYIKIADGCDHRCAFCAIPVIRGRQRSRPVDSIIAEARRLSAEGFREVILVAQDSTSYGRDLGMKDGLTDLLKGLRRIDSLEWIRPMYMFPGKVSRALLDVIAESPTICNYVDIPLQHSVPSILKAMGRTGNGEDYLRLLEQIRTVIPNSFVRTSLIVGYPGETDKDVEDLIEFVKKARFQHLGVFAYSREEGTPGFALGDPISHETKQERVSAIMEVQRDIAHSFNETLVGETLEVLVEGYSEETDLLLQGRHIGQAPEIDGVVLINEGSVNIGEKRSVLIEQALFHDIIGKIV